MANVADYYNETYFEGFQKKIGEFGGIANKFKFQDEIKEGDAVLDFGCGGGFLLKNIDCGKKTGIEINEVARKHCLSLGIDCYDSLNHIRDGSIDVVISNHCLEHVENPLDALSQLYKKIKPGGKIVIVIPLDSYKYSWQPNDVNNHLYSFSPMNLGNLLQNAGFKNIKASPLLHKWVPYYEKIYKWFGYNTFHFLSWIYGHYKKNVVQVKGIGYKI
jgi:2-polyprenyl-3-methyl-5-hydroxy-6-metoxy-1,4-benzoquinol methylase